MARATSKITPAKPKPMARKTKPRAAARGKSAPALPAAKNKANTAKTSRAVSKARKTSISSNRARSAKAAPVAPAPKVSKDELRDRVAKLEKTNATLKAKDRHANRAAKAANGRIAELEAEVAGLKEQAAHPAAAPNPEKTSRRGRPPRSREIDPGDAVPPGVAVRVPQPLDAEAETAREALEEHLPGE